MEKNNDKTAESKHVDIIIGAKNYKLRVRSKDPIHQVNNKQKTNTKHKDVYQREFEYDLIKKRIEYELNAKSDKNKVCGLKKSGLVISQSTPIKKPNEKNAVYPAGQQSIRNIRVNKSIADSKMELILQRTKDKLEYMLNKLNTSMNKTYTQQLQAINTVNKSLHNYIKRNKTKTRSVIATVSMGRKKYAVIKNEYDEHQAKSNNKCDCSTCKFAKENMTAILKKIAKDKAKMDNNMTSDESENESLAAKPNLTNKNNKQLRIENELLNASTSASLKNNNRQTISISNFLNKNFLKSNENKIETTDVPAENSKLSYSEASKRKSESDSKEPNANKQNITNYISNYNLEKISNEQTTDDQTSQLAIRMNEVESTENKLECLANGKHLVFGGDNLKNWINKSHKELITELQKVVNGILVKGITIVKENELHIICYDEVDYSILKSEKWQEKAFGGIKLLPIKSRLFIHVLVDAKLEISNTTLSEDLQRQGIEMITKDKPPPSSKQHNKKLRAMVEINSVEAWYSALEQGIIIDGVHHVAKRWKFTAKFCKKCHLYKHNQNKCSIEGNRCETCSLNHSSPDQCTKIIRCFNCRATTHKSGSQQCPVWRKEEALCNQLYDEMFIIRQPKSTKYNKHVNLHEPDATNRFNNNPRSSASSGCYSSVASSANKQVNMTMINLIDELRKEQENQASRLTAVETKVEEIQGSIKSTLLEALTEFHNTKK